MKRKHARLEGWQPASGTGTRKQRRADRARTPRKERPPGKSWRVIDRTIRDALYRRQAEKWMKNEKRLFLESCRILAGNPDADPFCLRYWGAQGRGRFGVLGS